MGETSRQFRRGLIELKHEQLSIRQQCELLKVNRSNLYYKRANISLDDVELLNHIRDIWCRYPFYGYRRITRQLKSDNIVVNRKRVQRLMRENGIKALYPKPKTSKRDRSHAVYPHLLSNLEINSANQVWQIDITYLRYGQGFMYLVALIDVYSRFVIGWSLSNTLDTLGCIEALEKSLCIARPVILNSDQGCQFTSEAWVSALESANIRISMTGKGRCLDNIYIERFWRSFKQEEFYLNDYTSVSELKSAIDRYVVFYNYERWHQSLDYKRPSELYFESKERPIDMWTSPSEQPAPFGPCAQVMDNANVLPTTCTHSLSS